MRSGRGTAGRRVGPQRDASESAGWSGASSHGQPQIKGTQLGFPDQLAPRPTALVPVFPRDILPLCPWVRSFMVPLLMTFQPCFLHLVIPDLSQGIPLTQHYIFMSSDVKAETAHLFSQDVFIYGLKIYTIIFPLNFNVFFQKSVSKFQMKQF